MKWLWDTPIFVFFGDEFPNIHISTLAWDIVRCYILHCNKRNIILIFYSFEGLRDSFYHLQIDKEIVFFITNGLSRIPVFDSLY